MPDTYRIVSGALTCVLLMAALGRAADTLDLRKVDRRIASEPRYTARQPLYGLLVLGPAMQRRLWMVLDQSKAGAKRYDLLYADLDGDGDLTEPAERFLGHAAGNEFRFKLPDLKDSATNEAHSRFTVRVSGDTTPTVMVSLTWRGRRKMGGGYPEDPESGYMKFGVRPENAPVLWANGDSPFRFQRWYSGKLTIGADDDFKVFVGHQGVGANSFWAFQEHFLPESEGVQATLVYRDTEDKERRATCLLKERC